MVQYYETVFMSMENIQNMSNNMKSLVCVVLLRAINIRYGLYFVMLNSKIDPIKGLINTAIARILLLKVGQIFGILCRCVNVHQGIFHI